MKKFFVLLETLVAAALFFSCANSSSDNLASHVSQTGGTNGTTSTTTNGTGTDSGSNGGSTNNTNNGQAAASGQLPASVGTNELAGKTFKSVGSQMVSTDKFEADTLTSTMTFNCVATPNCNPYDMVITYTMSYTYDSNSKVLYRIQQKEVASFFRNGVKLDMPKADFSTDAEFIAYQKNYFKLQFDLASDDYIETLAKQTRVNRFAQYGYTDTTGETPVSNEIIAKYNEAQKQAKHFISTTSYSVSDTGLKLVTDSRYPAGKDFNELFNYYSSLPVWQIKDDSDNTVYGLYQYDGVSSVGSAAAISTPTGGGTSGGTGGTSGGSGSGSFVNASTAASTTAFSLPLVSAFTCPSIMKSDGLLAYKVSSVDANAIHTCATGTRADTTAEFSFTDENKTFKYTTTKSENGAVVDIEGLGKINIVYATPATIPDFSTAIVTEYTLQQ